VTTRLLNSIRVRHLYQNIGPYADGAFAKHHRVCTTEKSPLSLRALPAAEPGAIAPLAPWLIRLRTYIITRKYRFVFKRSTMYVTNYGAGRDRVDVSHRANSVLWGTQLTGLYIYTRCGTQSTRLTNRLLFGDLGLTTEVSNLGKHIRYFPRIYSLSSYHDECSSLVGMCYSSNMAAALNYLRNTMFSSANGARTGVGKVAVIISNTNSVNRLATFNEADLTRRAGINLITVAVGSWLDPTELQAIASYPTDKNAIRVIDGYSSLSCSYHQQIQDLLCGSTSKS